MREATMAARGELGSRATPAGDSKGAPDAGTPTPQTDREQDAARRGRVWGRRQQLLQGVAQVAVCCWPCKCVSSIEGIRLRAAANDLMKRARCNLLISLRAFPLTGWAPGWASLMRLPYPFGHFLSTFEKHKGRHATNTRLPFVPVISLPCPLPLLAPSMRRLRRLCLKLRYCQPPDFQTRLPWAAALGLPFAALLTTPDPAPCPPHGQHLKTVSARHLRVQAGRERNLGHRRPPDCNSTWQSRLRHQDVG